MKKYFIYARTATETQRVNGTNLELQVKQLTDFAKKNNLTVIKTFTEIGSGMSDKRKIFKDMIQRLSKGEVNGIICRDLDRLSRNSHTMLILNQFMKKHNIEIITLNHEQIYNITPKSKFEMTILAAFEEYEYETKREFR